jgi:tetratricopeptide (TPR) repeat protein
MRGIAVAAVFGLALAAAGPALAQAIPPFSTERLYLTEQVFTQAIRPYQQAVQANPNNAPAQYWLGFAYLYAYRQYVGGLAPYAAEYLGRAERPLQEAIRINPGLVDAYLALQDVYHLRGDDDRANEMMAKVLELTRPKHLPSPKQQVDRGPW